MLISVNKLSRSDINENYSYHQTVVKAVNGKRIKNNVIIKGKMKLYIAKKSSKVSGYFHYQLSKCQVNTG